MSKRFVEDKVMIMTDNFNVDSVKKCHLICNLTKPIEFKSDMECSLVKIFVPEKLHSYSGSELYFNLHANFHMTHYPLIHQSNTIMHLKKKFPLDFKNFNDPNHEKILMETINQKCEEMNRMMIKIWNDKYAYENINMIDENSDGRIYDMMYDTPKRSGAITVRKLKILSKTNSSIELSPFMVIVDRRQGNPIKVTKSHIALDGYITFSEKLHELLGQSVKNYPIATHEPKGFTSGNEFPNIDKLFRAYIKMKISEPMKYNIDGIKIFPNTIFVYCDIIHETFVNSQKANILQI